MHNWKWLFNDWFGITSNNFSSLATRDNNCFSPEWHYTFNYRNSTTYAALRMLNKWIWVRWVAKVLHLFPLHFAPPYLKLLQLAVDLTLHLLHYCLFSYHSAYGHFGGQICIVFNGINDNERLFLQNACMKLME